MGCTTSMVLNESLDDLAMSGLFEFRFGLHLDFIRFCLSFHFQELLHVVQEISPSSALPTTLPMHLFHTNRDRDPSPGQGNGGFGQYRLLSALSVELPRLRPNVHFNMTRQRQENQENEARYAR